MKIILTLHLISLTFITVAEDFENFDIFFQSNTGRLVTLNAFLSSGADPNSTDKTGYTLLQRATLNQNTEAVNLLLNYGAIVNIDYPPVNMNGKSSKSIPPLIKLTDKVLSIPLKIVNLLLQNDLDTSVTDHQGNTALMRAIYLLNQWPDRYYRSRFIELLIRYKTNTNTQNHNGDTALHIASRMGDVETARLLLQNKSDWTLTNNQGITPLQVAKTMSGNIPPINADLKWYWYFSLFASNQYKIIRLIQKANSDSSQNNHPKKPCMISFI